MTESEYTRRRKMDNKKSTTLEQASELRKIAGWMEGRNAYIQKVLMQAADTLEDLSAKLAKQSSLVEKMAEELENCYGRETELTEDARRFSEAAREFIGNANAISR